MYLDSDTGIMETTMIEEKFQELIAVIEESGLEARAYFDTGSAVCEIKGDGSVVTAIDTSIENKICSFVRESFPDDTIVGEEGEGYVGTSSFTWHIDPIDGTDNFLRRIPFTAVSVARIGPSSEDSFGIIHNPITNQTFASLMDNGVYEQERVCQVTDELLGGKTVISLARGRESWMKSAGYNLQKGLGLKFGRCNSLNCCALELAYVAANRLDGVLSFGLHTYDYAAGLYIVKSAGGSISVFKNGMWSEWTDPLQDLLSQHGATFFASHRGIHEDALKIIGDPRSWSDEKES